MHLKRLNTPKRWNLEKKSNVFVAKPNCGAHPKKFCVPLIVLLRDHLGIVKTMKECKKIINEKKISVDNIIVKDTNLPVGLFDVVSLPENKLYYRIVLDYKGGIKPIEISAKESNIKPFKVLNKTRLKKKKTQINCTSGRNIIVKKSSYKTGDTLLLDLSTKKVVKHIPFSNGSFVLLTHGKHAGETAIITGVKNFKGMNADRVLLKNKDAEYETVKDYVFVLGEKKSEIVVKEK